MDNINLCVPSIYLGKSAFKESTCSRKIGRKINASKKSTKEKNINGKSVETSLFKPLRSKKSTKGFNKKNPTNAKKVETNKFFTANSIAKNTSNEDKKKNSFIL
jgi:hypothetical protein